MDTIDKIEDYNRDLNYDIVIDSISSSFGYKHIIQDLCDIVGYFNPDEEIFQIISCLNETLSAYGSSVGNLKLKYPSISDSIIVYYPDLDKSTVIWWNSLVRIREICSGSIVNPENRQHV